MPISTSEFCDTVGAYADGAPSHAIRRAVLDTAIDFCKATGSWQAALTPITASDGVQNYPLLYDEANVERLIEVKIDNAPIDAAIDYVQREVILARMPAAGAKITIDAVLVPQRDCDCLPDYLFEDWLDTISWGAMARLQRQPNKKWTDEKEAFKNQSLYDAQVVRARQREMTTGPVPKKMRFRGSWP